MMTKFIVISGKMQSGKDTAREMIVDSMLHDAGRVIAVDRVNFADPLKKMCNIVFGIPLEHLYGSDADKNRLTQISWDGFSSKIRAKYAIQPTRALRSGPMTIRELLQVMGTDIFREMVDTDVWAKAPFLRQWNSDFVIISDCRFPNELNLAKQHNATTIRIKRSSVLRSEHESEIALDGTPDSYFNFVIENNGSLEELKTACQSISEKLLS